MVKAFERELELSKQPGYQPAHINDYEDDHSDEPDIAEPRAGRSEIPSSAPTETASPPSEIPPEPEPKQDDTSFGEGII